MELMKTKVKYCTAA